MFEKLTKNKRYVIYSMLSLLVIAACLAIYFGFLYKGSIYPAPKFIRFSNKTPKLPWKIPTYYRYTYVDKVTFKPGEYSNILGPIQSDKYSEPVISVKNDKDYNIIMERSVGDNKNFQRIYVNINETQEFTDKDIETSISTLPKPSEPLVFNGYE